MFKITLGALIASIIAIFLPSRVHRLYFAGAILILFVIIEIIFIAHGGD
ncbi:MAG: hypothetical protein Q8916_06540 [Bacteroidota bacterium]|nr:hypothetical protein [Bacteroidota bacterium]MDP4230048.1 hypothetical protein [Bacteroidota bacterium]MDP4236044.1 hypothetical protein [Bacteroidota bacterium]